MASNVAFFVGDNNQVYRVDVADSGEETTTKLGVVKSWCTPVVFGDALFVQGSDNQLYKTNLDGSNTTKIGKALTIVRPFPTADCIYVVGLDNSLWAVNYDGASTRMTNTNTIGSRPYYYDGYIYFNSGTLNTIIDPEEPTYLSFDPIKGRLCRIRQGETSIQYFGIQMQNWPVVRNDYIYFRGMDSGLYRTNLDGTGTVALGGAKTANTPCVTDSYIFLQGTDKGNVWRTDLDGSNGVKLGGGEAYTDSAPAADETFCYVQGVDNGLYAFSISDTSLSYNLKNKTYFSPCSAVPDPTTYKTQNNPLISITQNTSMQLELSTSSDGTTWTAPQNLIGGNLACNPVSQVYDGSYFLAYQGWSGSSPTQELYIVSQAQLQNWDNSAQPSFKNIANNPCCMTVYGSYIYLIYQEATTNRLCCKYSFDAISWSSSSYIGTYTTLTPVSLAEFNGALYLVFQDSNSKKLMTTTSQNGKTWTTPVVFNLQNGLACNPSVINFDGSLYMTYQLWSNGVVSELYSATSENGITWIGGASITNKIDQYPSSLTVSENRFFAGFREASTGNLLASSSQDGSSWSLPKSVAETVIERAPSLMGYWWLGEARKLAEGTPTKPKENMGLPDLSSFTATLTEDSIYNWENSSKQKYWGFTGVICIKEYYQDSEDRVPVGSIVLFPGTRYKTGQNAEGGSTIPEYSGKCKINGESAKALKMKPVPPVTGALHMQLVAMLTPNYLGIEVVDFAQYFLGFAIAAPKVNGADYPSIKYISGALNNYYFEFVTPKKNKKCERLSSDWQKKIGDALRLAGINV